MPPDARLGSVSFETSCKPTMRDSVNRAVALLHSFWHNEAQLAFERIVAADPECAMGYWGEAMAHFHLGLSWPTPTDLEAGKQALAKADTAFEKSPRESAYIRALQGLYERFRPNDSWVAFKGYADDSQQIVADDPNDVEAKAFGGLALVVAQDPADIKLLQLRQAVTVLSSLLAQHRDHPGIAHYLIHACDTPSLARAGLDAARRYAQIAPPAPHALHMPSHIFARLGLWQEDIESNFASKAAAERTNGMRVGAEHRLHAMEFLEYAYLQIGRDDEARSIMTEGKAIPQSEVDPRYGDYYAIVQTRFPAMYALETRNWAVAAAVQPSAGGDKAAQNIVLLAHAIAAGHLSDRTLADRTARAAEAYVQGQNNGKPIPKAGTPEAGFLDEIHAWTRFAYGDVRGAVRLLGPVADWEEQLGKGELDLPTREMMAEMLLLSGRPKEALDAYQHSLETDPNRFNALLGAARAAELLRRPVLAMVYYRMLLENCAGLNRFRSPNP
jgi:hypothetical protein